MKQNKNHSIMLNNILLIALIPIAVAVSPAIFDWASNDRNVDSIIIKSAFTILSSSTENEEGKNIRNWAIKIVEKYSGEDFSEAEKQYLKTFSLPNPIILADIPLSLTTPCQNPVHLTSGTARAVEKAYRTDRAKLIICGKQLEAVVEWYKTRDSLYTGITTFKK